MFEELSQYPERAKRFGSAMSTYSKGAGYEPKYLADNYPWASFENGLVVDASSYDTQERFNHYELLTFNRSVVPLETFVSTSPPNSPVLNSLCRISPR